jgi:menaquinone-dependent protoporphyrinogen oxidase
MVERVLLCYGTRYGSTAEAAQEMSKAIQELGIKVDLVDLKNGPPSGPLHDYDLVIVGSGIQAGRWTKAPLDFISHNTDALAKIKVALFVVCGYAGSPDKCQIAQREYLDNIAASYPSLNVISTGLFGGVFDFKKYNFAVRTLVRSIMKKQIQGNEVPEVVDFRDLGKVRAWAVSLVRNASP